MWIVDQALARAGEGDVAEEVFIEQAALGVGVNVEAAALEFAALDFMMVTVSASRFGLSPDRGCSSVVEHHVANVVVVGSSPITRSRKPSDPGRTAPCRSGGRC